MDILKKIPFSSNQAIIFDIDDTLINSKTHKLIPPVFSLYQYCLSKKKQLVLLVF